MGISPQSEKDTILAESLPSAVLVREQLRRLVAHPLFTNSKRYPVLLAYIVEQTLLGNAGDLKERTIGVEAFGREPNYDVNLDPVVRTTAAEVRKGSFSTITAPTMRGSLSSKCRWVPTFPRFGNWHIIPPPPTAYRWPLSMLSPRLNTRRRPKFLRQIPKERLHILQFTTGR
jgi:hypothetical protein